MKKILIVNKNLFFKNKLKNSKKFKYIFITTKKKLTLKNVHKISPNLIFFPHWSFLVDKKILENYECVGFHSSPLPYGRGGSPIQNMVLRGHKKTKVCCFKLSPKLDEGKIYFDNNLSLSGTANEIFDRLYILIIKMIKKFLKKKYTPILQSGRVYHFKRRTKKDSLLEKNLNLLKLYDKIRILDYNQKNFPKAFIRHGKFKIIFYDPVIKRKKLFAKVKIYKGS